MEKITHEQIVKAIEEYDIQRWNIRRCSICDSWLAYVFRGDQIGFDSNCSCVNYVTPYSPRTMDEFADIFNTQNTEEQQRKLWNDFIMHGSKYNG